MLMDVRVEHVEGWAEELAALTGGLGHLFARQEPQEVLADLIEGLLSDLGRKNGWMSIPSNRAWSWSSISSRSSCLTMSMARTVGGWSDRQLRN